MNKLHFIKAPCHQSDREQKVQFAPNEIKEKYDYEIDMKLFDDSIVGDEIKLCPGYNLLYSHISKYLKDNPNDKIITIGGDNSISAGSIPAINERYGKDLIILWIDSSPDINDFITSTTKKLNEMPVASILGLCGDKFTKSKTDVLPNQIIYFGLNEDDDQLEIVRNKQIPFFTNKKINSIGCDDIVQMIKTMIGKRPVHVSLDMKVFHKDIIKCVIPPNNRGLDISNIEKLLLALKSNIVSMDISEFNPEIDKTENNIKVTRELIRYLLIKTFDMKEKSINIFTEDSQFLIFRPLEQEEDPEADIGWYILRGIDLETKEELLNNIKDDNIITIDIDDETYLVTKTTMNEQNEISYYTAHSINDAVLFPQEKALMMFELVNT
ncbi:MAG: arginase family protein [Nitrososphaeraceae archaeon]|nr:arginase family protein [Nitrososphaeraceae archaeon]